MSENLENRVDSVSPDVVLELTRLGAGTLHFMKNQELYEKLPPELSLDEITTLGSRVSDLTELVYPSRDALSHGDKNRSGMVYKLAITALSRGDVVTARSSAEFLGSRPRIKNRVTAFFLKRNIVKKTSTDNSLQTP